MVSRETLGTHRHLTLLVSAITIPRMSSAAAEVRHAEMPRGAPTIQVGIRISPEWVEIADKLAAELSQPGLPVSRADAVRVLLAKGIEAHLRGASPAAEPPKTATKKPTRSK